MSLPRRPSARAARLLATVRPPPQDVRACRSPRVSRPPQAPNQPEHADKRRGRTDDKGPDRTHHDPERDEEARAADLEHESHIHDKYIPADLWHGTQAREPPRWGAPMSWDSRESGVPASDRGRQGLRGVGRQVVGAPCRGTRPARGARTGPAPHTPDARRPRRPRSSSSPSRSPTRPRRAESPAATRPLRTAVVALEPRRCVAVFSVAAARR